MEQNEQKTFLSYFNIFPCCKYEKQIQFMLLNEHDDPLGIIRI